MKKFLLLGGVAAMLAACATQYVAPVGVPTATRTLAADLSQNPGSWVLVQKFDTESCAPSADGNRLASFSTKAIQGEGDPKSGVTRTVAASKPIIFSFVYQHGAAGFTDYTTCIATQSFVPAAGARYRADFRTSGDRCAVLVTREDGSDPMAVEALHPIEPACFNTING